MTRPQVLIPPLAVSSGKMTAVVKPTRPPRSRDFLPLLRCLFLTSAFATSSGLFFCCLTINMLDNLGGKAVHSANNDASVITAVARASGAS